MSKMLVLLLIIVKNSNNSLYSYLVPILQQWNSHMAMLSWHNLVLEPSQQKFQKEKHHDLLKRSGCGHPV
jgi:hypothetical protein